MGLNLYRVLGKTVEGNSGKKNKLLYKILRVRSGEFYKEILKSLIKSVKTR